MAGAARRARNGERPAWPGGTAAGWGGSMAGGTTTTADRAVEADPLLPGADELLAVADVLLASQSMGPSGHPDPLAILQLPPGASLDHAAVSRAFRRLALLALDCWKAKKHPNSTTKLNWVLKTKKTHDLQILISESNGHNNHNPILQI